jgi:hypothetical protein
MINSVIAMSFTGLSFQLFVSITQRGAVTSRIRAAFQESLLTINANNACVTHIVIPVGDHLHRLSSTLQFTDDLI